MGIHNTTLYDADLENKTAMAVFNRGRPKLLPAESSEWVLAAARGGRLRSRLVAHMRAQ